MAERFRRREVQRIRFAVYDLQELQTLSPTPANSDPEHLCQVIFAHGGQVEPARDLLLEGHVRMAERFRRRGSHPVWVWGLRMTITTEVWGVVRGVECREVMG